MDEKKTINESSYFKKVLLHEYFMFAFMAEIVIRLAQRPKMSIWILYYFIVAVFYGAFIYWGIKSGSSKVNRIRLFVSFFIMNFNYSSIKYVIPDLGMPIMDSVLVKIDNFLIGRDLSLFAQEFYSRPLTEIMSLAYTLHFVPLVASIIYYAFLSDMKKAYVFYSGIISVFAVGFIGYSIVPAKGPFWYFSGQYTKSLIGYYYTDFNTKIVGAGSAIFDVFPSLHVGIATFLLLFFYGNNKKAFKFYVPLYILIVLSTVYLRYHYFIDLICGAILSILLYNLSKKSAVLLNNDKK